ncbi:large ribosomal subunit protein mL54 [Panulirus ornatus]|uniref:large ribosomal subunit protein mL54 n=1 Tax=Panulirus ornatus TaxID=150431 RepID=UPI003A878117
MAASCSGAFAFQVLRASVTTSYRLTFLPTCTQVQQMNYAKPLFAAKKGKGKLEPVAVKVHLPVEADPEKLVNFVCGSHPVKEDREDITIKDDPEYPEWLWTLRTEKLPPLSEMDPNTKQYWRRLRTMAMKQKNLIKKVKKF